MTDVREADVGSILGFGFAPSTVGLFLNHGMGVKNLSNVQRSRESLRGAIQAVEASTDTAKKGETFYGCFARAKRKAARVTPRCRIASRTRRVSGRG